MEGEAGVGVVNECPRATHEHGNHVHASAQAATAR
jgi:hypothetical protein